MVTELEATVPDVDGVGVDGVDRSGGVGRVANRFKMICVAVPFETLAPLGIDGNMDLRPRTLKGGRVGILSADLSGIRFGTGGVFRGKTAGRVGRGVARNPTVRRRVILFSRWRMIRSNAVIRSMLIDGT